MYNFFKIGSFVLFFSLFFVPFFSYGKEEVLFKNKIHGQPVFKTASLYLDESGGFESDSSGESLLSIKGGLAIVGFVESIFLPVLLELQTPVIVKDNRLKWVIQSGVGGSWLYSSSAFDPSDLSFFLPVDTGLRYDFQPFDVSLKVGAMLIFGPAHRLRDGPTTSSVAIDIGFKGLLSVGWNIEDKVRLELSGGIFSNSALYASSHFSPFIGLSASVPLKRW